jgi:hypothetical protein
MWQSRDVVTRLNGPDQQLARDGPVLRMERQGLFRRQAPILALELLEIGSTEWPEGGIPGGTFAGCLARVGGDIPALDYLLQKTVSDQAFPVGPR